MQEEKEQRFRVKVNSVVLRDTYSHVSGRKDRIGLQRKIGSVFGKRLGRFFARFRRNFGFFASFVGISRRIRKDSKVQEERKIRDRK